MVIRPTDVAYDIWRWHTFHCCCPDGRLKGRLVPLIQNEMPKKKKKLQQIPLCSGGHKAICLDFNYEGLWERGTLGSSMNHCHSASLPLFSWIKTLPAQVASLLVIKKPRKCCFHFLVGAERISQIAECLFFPPENSGWEQVKHESKPQETCY